MANVPDVEVYEDGEGGESGHSEPSQHEDVSQHDELKEQQKANGSRLGTVSVNSSNVRLSIFKIKRIRDWTDVFCILMH